MTHPKNNAAEADGKLKTCKITKQSANKGKIFREKNGKETINKRKTKFYKL